SNMRFSTGPRSTSAPGGTIAAPMPLATAQPARRRTFARRPWPQRRSAAPTRSATSTRAGPSVPMSLPATGARSGGEVRPEPMCALRILLTHTPEMRQNYFGEHALACLRAVGEVRLHDGREPLETPGLIAAAAGCQIVVADRATACDGHALAQLPELSAVCRVAVDIRHIDGAAASAHGIIVTHAGRPWVAAVSELVIGLMLDAARGISRANIAYKRGEMPEVTMGRQLAGSTAGIIGYGPLGRSVAELALAFGMHVLVSDPYVIV